MFNNYKRIYTLFFLLCILFSKDGFAKETEKNKFYLYFAGGTGNILKASSSYIATETLINHTIFNINTGTTDYQSLAILATDYQTVYTTMTTPLHLGFVYRLNKSLDLQLGFRNTTFKIKSPNHPADSLIPFYELQQLNNYPSNSLTTLILGLSLYRNQNFSSVLATLRTDTLDFGLNYHLLGDGLVDPYVGVSFGYGTCSGNDNCSVTKGGGKLGLQLNFGSFFTFLQGELEYLNFTFSGGNGFSLFKNDYNNLPSGRNKMILFGLGIGL